MGTQSSFHHCKKNVGENTKPLQLKPKFDMTFKYKTPKRVPRVKSLSTNRMSSQSARPLGRVFLLEEVPRVVLRHQTGIDKKL